MRSLPSHGSSLPHRFGSSAPFTVGVTEELLLVDPATRAPVHATDAVLARLPRFLRGQVAGTPHAGVVALTTPACEDVGQAVERLGALRAAVLRTGVADLLGAGVHPTAPHGDLLAPAACCGLHVHVAMPGPEAAVAAFNGMRKWAPVLHAVAANSPFAGGRDARMASSRAAILHARPRSGLPGPFRDWDHYGQAAGALVAAAELEGIGALGWDLRLLPGPGTLEVRIADAQSALADVEGLVALIHGLVQHEALVADGDHPDRDLLDEAAFRAARDGLDARIALGGAMRHVQDVAAHAVAVAFPYAARAGCADAIDHVESVLVTGNGALRQRAAFARGGMAEVLRALAEETAAPPPAPRRHAPVALGGAA